MSKMKIVGLDIGSGFTKCFDGERKIIFPSIYAYRHPTIWEEGSEIIEGVGENALGIISYPNSVKLYPVIDGKPQHQAFIKLAKEALKRLNIGFFDKVCLVSGLPYETGKQDRERIKQTLKENLRLEEIAVYPQAIGTLFDLDFQSATVINIGHGTTEILIIENLNVLGGISEPLASDYIVSAISNHIQSKHGFKASVESIIDLIVGKTEEITTFGKIVHREDVDSLMKKNVDYLADKICYDARYMLNQLPPNLDCANRIVLSGGGGLIKGMREAVKQRLGVEVILPSDPIFSNVQGFYKIGRKLYG
jgi:actin-like ATPase involved in cell morphogenesis